MSSHNNRLQYPILLHREAETAVFKNKGRKWAGRRWRLVVERSKVSFEAVAVNTKPIPYKKQRPPISAYKPMELLR